MEPVNQLGDGSHIKHKNKTGPAYDEKQRLTQI
jgi:hypothetical protein